MGIAEKELWLTLHQFYWKINNSRSLQRDSNISWTSWAEIKAVSFRIFITTIMTNIWLLWHWHESSPSAPIVNYNWILHSFYLKPFRCCTQTKHQLPIACFPSSFNSIIRVLYMPHFMSWGIYCIDFDLKAISTMHIFSVYVCVRAFVFFPHQIEWQTEKRWSFDWNMYSCRVLFLLFIAFICSLVAAVAQINGFNLPIRQNNILLFSYFPLFRSFLALVQRAFQHFASESEDWLHSRESTKERKYESAGNAIAWNRLKCYLDQNTGKWNESQTNYYLFEWNFII